MATQNGNAGTKLLGLEFAPLKIPIQRRLQTLGALYVSTSFLFFWLFGLVLCLYMFFFTTYLHYIPVIYLTWFFTDKDVCNRGGRMFRWTRTWRIWTWFRDYFPIKLIKTAELPTNRHYIFGYHPHGIMAAGALCNFSTDATGFNETFPGLTSRVITLQGQFMFPFHRDHNLALGFCAASKESIEYLLNEKNVSNAVVLVIGGAAEALEAHPKKSVLTLKKRKGFVRLALKNGASLVPVYSFGENDIFNQVDNPVGSWLRRIQDILTKKMGVSLPLIRGRGIFQYNFGYLPFRKPIYTVVGEPIYLDKVTNPSEDLVSQIHERYLKSLTELFDKHKAKYGMEEQTLVIK